jgi:hypothetical protein
MRFGDTLRVVATKLSCSCISNGSLSAAGRHLHKLSNSPGVVAWHDKKSDMSHDPCAQIPNPKMAQRIASFSE